VQIKEMYGVPFEIKFDLKKMGIRLEYEIQNWFLKVNARSSKQNLYLKKKYVDPFE
jgi:hypothetical protein